MFFNWKTVDTKKNSFFSFSPYFLKLKKIKTFDKENDKIVIEYKFCSTCANKLDQNFVRIFSSGFFEN